MLSPLFVEAMQKVQMVLLQTPELLELQQDHNEIIWVYNTPQVKKARKEVRTILDEMWQQGAFNYAEIARSLRIDTETVQALMDKEYIEKHGL